MKETFTVKDPESISYTLEYSNLKEKELSSVCEITLNKWMNTSAIVVSVLFVLVVFYDFFKDFGRNVSMFKDIFSDKPQQASAKFLGLTKGNITRTVIKIILFIIAAVLFQYSYKYDCITDKFLLKYLATKIKYDSNGIPVEMESLTKK